MMILALLAVAVVAAFAAIHSVYGRRQHRQELTGLKRQVDELLQEVATTAALRAVADWTPRARAHHPAAAPASAAGRPVLRVINGGTR